MKKVCIQVGHWGIEQIDTSEQHAQLRSWRDTSVLKRSTGASGERDYFWNEIMPRLRDKLIAAGVQVYIVDAIYRAETYNQNYDLWVSLHYDGGGTENRSMISSPLRGASPAYLNTQAHNEADRFCEIWRRTYPAKTGTINRDERITAAMREYYAFDYVPYDTPAAIIEHFNHTSAVGEQLKTNSDVVAQADFEAIIEFLGITNQPQPVNLGDKQIDFDDPDGQRRQVKWYVAEWWNRKDQVARLEGDVATRDTTIAERDQTIKAKIAEIGELNAKLTKAQTECSAKLEEKGKIIGDLTTKNTNLQTTITSLKADITAKDNRIAELISNQNTELTVGEVLKLLWEKIKPIKLR